MPIFKSNLPDILLPTNVTSWQFLFSSAYSPLSRSEPLAGYQNALTGDRLDWQQVKDLSTYISTALVKKYNLQPGDTISLFSQNSIWYPVAMHGGLRVGAKISGASPAYTVDEMAYALRIGQTRFFMTAESSLEVALEAAKMAGVPRDRIFLLEGKAEGFETVHDLIRIGREFGEAGQVPVWEIPRGQRNGDVCGYLSFSSGTTGLPKAVMISHQNVIAQCLQVAPLTPPNSTHALAVLPLFHITGLVHQLHLPVMMNAEVMMTPTFTIESMLEIAVKNQMKELLVVPPILIRLIRDPILKKYDTSGILRFASGAAPVSPEVLEEVARIFPQSATGKPYGQTGLKQGYGMTESCSCITAYPLHRVSGYKYENSVGEIVGSTEVKIIKEDGTEAGVNEAGEILARGPQITMGYLGNDKATKETFDSEGFLHTGDMGKIDEDGMVWILDRIKELIKVKGTQVAPAELEDLLLGHPKIEDCAVLGIPDDMAGELPKAFIVLKSGVEKNEAIGRDILQYVKDKKIRYKWIKEVEFLDAIPKSASGKILRKDLRNRTGGQHRGLVVRDGGERAKL